MFPKEIAVGSDLQYLFEDSKVGTVNLTKFPFNQVKYQYFNY
jgi:hypothetical protein